MNGRKILAFDKDPSELPNGRRERHEVFVDLFGQYLFWLRNWAMDSSRRLVESAELREKLGAIRRKCFEDAAQMTSDQRKAALALTEETLNGFAERLVWSLGDEGT